MFDLSVSHLKKINNLYTDDIFPGQVLKVIDNKKEFSHLLEEPANKLESGGGHIISKSPLTLDELIFEEESKKDYGRSMSMFTPDHNASKPFR